VNSAPKAVNPNSDEMVPETAVADDAKKFQVVVDTCVQTARPNPATAHRGDRLVLGASAVTHAQR